MICKILLKADQLHYKWKRRKVYKFNEYSLRYTRGRIWDLSLEQVEDDQINFADKLKDLFKGKKQFKKSFFKQLRIIL